MSGPEVPFPTMTDADHETAEKFGFGPVGPFPLQEPRALPLKLSSKRVFGKASYKANAIAGVVTITATGYAPNFNTIVQLVQMNIMIWPPRWALYFIEPEIALPAIKPFVVEASFHTQAHLEAVVVQDSDGVQVVSVENF